MLAAATIHRMTRPSMSPPRRPTSQATLARSRTSAVITAAIQSGTATRKNASRQGRPAWK